MWPQEETEERLRKTKFIILTVLRDRRLGTPWGEGSMWEKPEGQEAEDVGGA